MPGDEIPFSEAEARAPFSFLGDQTVALCDNIFSNKQLLSRPVPFRYVLHRETVKEKDGKMIGQEIAVWMGVKWETWTIIIREMMGVVKIQQETEQI